MRLGLAATLSTVLSVPAQAGDPEAGRALIESWRCVQCHGLSGNERGAGTHPAPMIAGQPEAFLVKRLTQYREGFFVASDDSLMSEVASALDDRAIEDIAAWYASQQRY